MKRLDVCSKLLASSTLAALAACTGVDGERDGESVAAMAGPTALDAGAITVDAGMGAATLDAGPPMGSRPRDRCSPSGEGNLPWAPCDATRGLVCVAPPRGLLDAPSTCQCPAGKTFVGEACAER